MTVEKSLDPSKVLELVKVAEEDDVFSFSQINLYKTDVRSLKKNLWSLDQNKKKPQFHSEKSRDLHCFIYHLMNGNISNSFEIDSLPKSKL